MDSRNPHGDKPWCYTSDDKERLATQRFEVIIDVKGQPTRV